MTDIIYSNIAIDMGGKHTGVASYTSGDVPSQEDIHAAILEMPNQGEGFNYTVKERTATRHRLRSQDRYVMARRLIYAIISSICKRPLIQGEKEAISSLMLRRGYTRLESETDTSPIEECQSDCFRDICSECCPEFFPENDTWSLLERFTGNCTKDLITRFEKALQSEQIKNKLKEIKDKEERKTCEKALKAMLEAVGKFREEMEFGHKHRKEYLGCIRSDILKDTRLDDIKSHFADADSLYKCIGNISNLQLRALRWYFDDPEMNRESTFNDEKFRKVWIRAYQYFHYPKDSAEDLEKKNLVDKFIAEARAAANITDLLCNLDPEVTIPPYEDQNNRRPPVDQTLLLSPLALDKQYPQWENWVQKFMNSENELNPLLLSGLDEILDLYDRKSRLPAGKNKASENAASYTREKLKQSYYLQRLLDLSAPDKKEKLNEENSLQGIRKWAYDEKNKEYETNELIVSILGDTERNSFQEFCQKYYKEISLSKKGLWSICESPVMEISGIHPCMKNKMLDKLVAGVLNIRKNFDFGKFKEIWSSRIKGTSTAKSMCAAIEKIRKDYGNSFRYEYKQACQKIQLMDQAGKKTYSGPLKPPADLSKVFELTKDVSEFLGRNLGLNESEISKFNNPYSLAQLYTILETETNGFSSTCEAVTLENNCRMQTTAHGKALCCRLPAESVRPFDGSLAKILDRQAYEIAKIKTNELLELDAIKNTTVKISILVEENSFEFSSSIATIKKSEKAKKLQEKAAKADEKIKQSWLSKEDRLKNDSHDICAYTGFSLINNACEIDHIIPRSESLAQRGTIFNSEFNLIRVSRTGNQKKKESIYSLDDLNDTYLKNIFNTSSRIEIKTTISSTVASIAQKNPSFNIDIMTEMERQCCRHALFLRPSEQAFKTVTDAIAKQGRTLVNGTQAWFIKAIISKLNTSLAEWKKSHNVNIEYDAFKILATDNHETRMKLGEQFPELNKRTIQPITSHAIDALCMFGTAAAVPRISDEISVKDGNLKSLTEISNLKNLIPDNYEIIGIRNKDFLDKSAPGTKHLFKDTIYGENFLNIMIRDSVVKIGFDWGNNNIEVTSGGANLLNCLAEYLTSNKDSNSPVITYRVNKNKAFELFSKYFNNETNSEENKVYQCLNALHYTTLHQNVATQLYDEQKKSFLALDKIINNKNTEIKIGKFAKELKIKFSDNPKTLTLPAKNQWLKIINEFEDFIGKKDANNTGKDKLDSFIRNHLSKSDKSKLKHKKCSRIYSLPLLDNPSGGIRIRRINDDLVPVYQLVAANTPVTSISKGFEADESGNVKWDTPIPADPYTKGNLTILDARKSPSKHSVKMNDERLVYASDEPYLRIYVKPSSVDRRKLTVEQNFSDFVKCLGDNQNFKTFHDLPSVIKLDKPDDFSKIFSEITGNSLCGKPRGKLELLSVGKIVKYRYSQESSGKEINKSYNTPIHKDVDLDL